MAGTLAAQETLRFKERGERDSGQEKSQSERKGQKSQGDGKLEIVYAKNRGGVFEENQRHDN